MPSGRLAGLIARHSGRSRLCRGLLPTARPVQDRRLEALSGVLFFRLAVILRGIHRRYLDGNAANAETALLYGKTAPILAGLADEAV